jgi:hypothetical protein
MEIVGFIGAVIVLLFIGVGIAIGLAACAAVAALTSIGVISSSVLVGFWKGRTLAGVQAFSVQCGVLAGAPTGAVLAWAAWHLWPMLSGEWQVLAAGALGGAAGGLVMAWLASTAAAGVAKHTWPWLRAKVTVLHSGHS